MGEIRQEAKKETEETLMAAFILIAFILIVVVGGFLYTLIAGILNEFPAGPDTVTMQFLDWGLAYIMLIVLVVGILWYLNKMQQEKNPYYGG